MDGINKYKTAVRVRARKRGEGGDAQSTTFLRREVKIFTIF